MRHAVLFLHTRAQTSSLNVTAGDYSARNRSPIDPPALEPSAAPRRRALPLSTTRQSPPGVGERGRAAALSPSLISAAMASSATSILASSAPPLRAGALTRGPTARGSLSIPSSFERARTSMLQLDPSYADDYPDMVPVVPDTRSAEMVLSGIVPNTRCATSPSTAVTEDEVEVGMAAGGVCVGGGDGEVLLDDSKLGDDRRELMSRQQVQQSFRADAPVSLEQVGLVVASFWVVLMMVGLRLLLFTTDRSYLSVPSLIVTTASTCCGRYRATGMWSLYCTLELGPQKLRRSTHALRRRVVVARGK